MFFRRGSLMTTVSKLTKVANSIRQAYAFDQDYDSMNLDPMTKEAIGQATMNELAKMFHQDAVSHRASQIKVATSKQAVDAILKKEAIGEVLGVSANDIFSARDLTGIEKQVLSESGLLDSAFSKKLTGALEYAPLSNRLVSQNASILSALPGSKNLQKLKLLDSLKELNNGAPIRGISSHLNQQIGTLTGIDPKIAKGLQALNPSNAFNPTWFGRRAVDNTSRLLSQLPEELLTPEIVAKTKLIRAKALAGASPDLMKVINRGLVQDSMSGLLGKGLKRGGKIGLGLAGATAGLGALYAGYDYLTNDEQKDLHYNELNKAFVPRLPNEITPGRADTEDYLRNAAIGGGIGALGYAGAKLLGGDYMIDPSKMAFWGATGAGLGALATDPFHQYDPFAKTSAAQHIPGLNKRAEIFTLDLRNRMIGGAVLGAGVGAGMTLPIGGLGAIPGGIAGGLGAAVNRGEDKLLNYAGEGMGLDNNWARNIAGGAAIGGGLGALAGGITGAYSPDMFVETNSRSPEVSDRIMAALLGAGAFGGAGAIIGGAGGAFIRGRGKINQLLGSGIAERETLGAEDKPGDNFWG